MSIFEDKNLLEMFAKIANELDGKISKKAQEAPGPTDYAAVQKMITSLQHRIRPPATEEGAEVAPEKANVEQAGLNQNLQTKPVSPEILQHLASSRPFHSDNIDLARINGFLDEYLQLNPSVESTVEAAKNSIAQAANFMQSTLPIQMSGLTPEGMAYLVKPAPGQGAAQTIVPFINALISAITAAGQVYGEFFNSEQQHLKDQELFNDVAAQISGPQSPYSINLADLQQLHAEATAQLGHR
jgi:hypothetical protein